MFMIFSFQVRPLKRLGAHGEASAGDKFLAFKELALPPVLTVTSQFTREASTVFGEGPLHSVGRWVSWGRQFRVRRVEGIVSHRSRQSFLGRRIAMGRITRPRPGSTCQLPNQRSGRRGYYLASFESCRNERINGVIPFKGVNVSMSSPPPGIVGVSIVRSRHSVTMS
jgi:hypothetical protein